MAAELITPVDELTGIPLPILPAVHLKRNDPNTNWHHAWHDDAAEQLQGLAGRALRHSRVQLVRSIDHNFKHNGRPNYHNYFIGPTLPETDEQKFWLCVIAATNYVPDTAIDLDGKDGPEIVRMTDEQSKILKAAAHYKPLKYDEVNRVKKHALRNYRSMRQSGPRRKYIADSLKAAEQNHQTQVSFGLNHLVYQYEPMRDFFRQYIVAQDIANTPQSLIDEFLSIPCPDTKERLGRKMVKLAVNYVAEPIEQPYQQLRKQGKLHPKMPTQAKSLVYYKLGNSQERAVLALQRATVLREQLATQ